MIVKEKKKEQITHRYPANPYLQIKVLLTDAVFNASYKDVQHNFFDGEKNPSENENIDFKWPVLLCFLNQRRFE